MAIMKRKAARQSLHLLVVCFFLLSLEGCASFLHFGHRRSAGLGAESLPPYSGPKARMAVADFEVRAAKATNEVGLGLREMLNTALASSQRFNVLERQALDTMIQQESPKGSGLVLTAAITEFEPQASGGRSGIGGGGGSGSSMFGGLLGGALNKAQLVIDMRITDATTSEVLAATSVRGQASDTDMKRLSGFFGGWKLDARLSAYANTPMEKAMRICIVEAARYISQALPVSYYKY